MCVDMLHLLADQGKAVGAFADLGTGSAVLAIVAAKLGWSPVLGVDHELPALEAAGENAAANGVEIEFVRANLRAEPAPAASTVVANLTAPVLRDVAANMADPPEHLVLSGLLTEEAQAVADEFSGHGLKVADRLDSGDWSALLLTG
jgi:ribosomal protein L11 methyltransferase